MSNINYLLVYEIGGHLTKRNTYDCVRFNQLDDNGELCEEIKNCKHIGILYKWENDKWVFKNIKIPANLSHNGNPSEWITQWHDPIASIQERMENNLEKNNLSKDDLN